MLNFEYMKLATQVAMQNLGRTGTNPSVGAVIVEGNLISTGITGLNGTPHAEINAIENAKKIGINLKKSTLYVTLEPCCHYGKTPPCAKSIVEEGIYKVFFGFHDPDPRVNGGGVKFLQENGIYTEFLPINETNQLHKSYSIFKTKNRPFVSLKIASSLDSKIALSNGKSKWITNQNARNYTNFIRSRFNGILVGANTIRTDSPKLDCRIEGLQHFSPKKFVASKTNFSNYTNVFGTIEEILLQIHQKNIQRLLVEGGGNLITQFLQSNLFDELTLIQSPIFLGGDSKNAIENLNLKEIPEQNLEITSQKIFNHNTITTYNNLNAK
jgi:diaminohydroxyphosphoribosylaminopyrimidine deaminase/5-amino-6-(5-phosphoribosylamino)uracil reductase